MKVFYPLEVFYPSQAGGAANSVYWIVKHLAEHGIEPVVVTTNEGINNSVPLNRWVDSGFGKTIYVKTFRYYFPFRQTFVALRNFLKCDVIHPASVFFPTAFVTSIAAWVFGKKVILSPRGELDPDALKYSRVKKAPVLWLLKTFLARYITFHSTCKEETAYIRKIFGDDSKIIEIPNFIELPEPVKRAPEKYLLFIGRIHPKKAVDNLIRAVAESADFLSAGFVLKIAGNGQTEYESELKTLVSDLKLDQKIEFLGHTEGPQKQQLYANAYFTIMPSHTENFGNVVLESLAQSTPVAASHGTPWKSLEDEKIGFWRDNSVPELAKLLTQIIQMPEDEYAGFRERSRLHVEREFDVKSNIGTWVQVYRNLL